MRPRRLQLQGFGPFAEPVDLDFTDVELFALVGPTGAGKSTVIDAMCFALYGSVPRYDDRRLVGSVVHALASEARVAFTFELGGAEYVALRVVRRDFSRAKNPEQHGRQSPAGVRRHQVPRDPGPQAIADLRELPDPHRNVRAPLDQRRQTGPRHEQKAGRLDRPIGQFSWAAGQESLGSEPVARAHDVAHQRRLPPVSAVHAHGAGKDPIKTVRLVVLAENARSRPRFDDNPFTDQQGPERGGMFRQPPPGSENGLHSGWRNAGRGRLGHS